MRFSVLFFFITTLTGFGSVAHAQVIDSCCVTYIENPDTPAGADQSPPGPIAETEGLSISASGNVESGWIFRDQSFDYVQEPFYSGSLDFATEHFGGGVWGGIADDAWEIDLTGNMRGQVAGAEVVFQLGYYITAGPEIYDAKLTATWPVGDACTIALSGEFMRGGLDDTVTKTEFGCSSELTDKVSVDYAAGVAYSTWAERPSVPWSVGLNYKLDNGTTVSIYSEGFFAEESAAIVGLGFTVPIK